MAKHDNSKDGLNIIVLVRWFVKWNGTATVAYNLSKTLIRRGHKISVITYKDYADPSWSREIPTITLNKKYFDLSSLIDIARIIKKINPDIVHSHGLLGLSAIYANVPYIVTYHGEWPMNIFTSAKAFLSTFSLFPLQILEMKHAKKTICVSSYSQRVLRTFNIDATVIPNGIEERRILKNMNILEEKENVAVFLGAITKKKAKLLPRVIKEITNLYKNFRVLVIGKVVDHDIHRALLKLPNTVVLGFVDNKWFFLDRAKVLLIPSVSENIPMAVMEAFARGVPVVAFKIGGLPDIVIDNFNGFLINKGDIKSFAKKVIEIFEDSLLYKKLSTNAIKFVKRYTWDHIAERYEKILYKACGYH